MPQLLCAWPRCHAHYDHDAETPMGWMVARQAAARAGWTRDQLADYCPRHPVMEHDEDGGDEAWPNHPPSATNLPVFDALVNNLANGRPLGEGVPERARFISELDACPACGDTWAMYSDTGGRTSRIIARVWNDRVAEWFCPSCGASWERGATVEGGTSRGDGPKPGELRTHDVETWWGAGLEVEEGDAPDA